MSKQEIHELLGVAKDGTRTVAERHEALTLADQARKERKMSWAKLGIPDADELIDQLDALMKQESGDDASLIGHDNGDVVEGEVLGSGEGDPLGEGDGGSQVITEGFDEGEGPLRKLQATRADITVWLSTGKSLTASKLAEIMDVPREDVVLAFEGWDEVVGEGDEGHELYTLKVQPKPARRSAAVKPAKVVDPNRGKVTTLTNALLMDASLSYADIVARIHRECPGCSTTARSVASVAAELRKKGVDVPTRRVQAAPKPTPEAPTAEAPSAPSEDADEHEDEADAALDGAPEAPTAAEGEGEQPQG